MLNAPRQPDLETLWQARLNTGEITFDSAQQEAIKVLQKFLDRLYERRASARGLLDRLSRRSSRQRPSGLYLYGDVGRGKTMLMDLFFEAAPSTCKRRVHFHSFMLEVHDRLHQSQKYHADEVLPDLARAIAKETRLLCFDEFHVNNIADAMILGRLFLVLFDAGVRIFATSNWAPDDLYKNGLQRERFLPFIDIIKSRMIIHHLQGAIDYRYEKMHGLPVCFHPLGKGSTQKLQELFAQLSDGAKPESVTLPVQGRTLQIAHVAKGVGFFTFEELCGTPLGTADYLALAEYLHAILIDGVPVMQADRRDETLRFMKLIDTLYEAKTKIFMGSAAAPEHLVPSGEDSFLFQRTVSRLIEMSSEEYRHKPHLG